jgi:pimeloyl-ACP methyl ester carboxylesterase
MKLKTILYSLLALVIFAPIVLYVGSLDWSRKHTEIVSNLPLFSKNAADGLYRLPANGYEFVVRVAGMNNTGKAVILLHGFPESSLMWESLIKKTAQAGYKVVAFDQRGYSPNARPSGVEAYHLNQLSSDVLAVANRVGFEKFHLLGHDWGAAVGCKTVMENPTKILTWTALSIPHIGAFFNGVINDTTQRKRSGYFKLFQKPILPEFLLTYFGQKTLKGFLEKLPVQQKEEYLSILAEPGALTAELNWYRAMDVESFVKNKTFEKPINCPTLFIWGKKDFVIAESVIMNQTPYFKNSLTVLPLDAGHNLIQEKEQEVTDAVLKHWKTKTNK